MLILGWIEVEQRRISVEEIVSSLKNGEITEAFGTGTAATIATIELIGDDKNDYNIPAPNQDSFSTKVFTELDDIKTGKKEDPPGWIYNI